MHHCMCFTCAWVRTRLMSWYFSGCSGFLPFHRLIMCIKYSLYICSSHLYMTLAVKKGCKTPTTNQPTIKKPSKWVSLCQNVKKILKTPKINGPLRNGTRAAKRIRGARGKYLIGGPHSSRWVGVTYLLLFPLFGGPEAGAPMATTFSFFSRTFFWLPLFGAPHKPGPGETCPPPPLPPLGGP